MRHPCHMNCEPRGDADERFFVYIAADITSYGHTVDAHTRERYPEDWPRTLAIREDGRDFGCWHSPLCPDGELCAFSPQLCREIAREEFERADAEGWPQVRDDLTSAAPAFAIYTFGEGGISKIWDSVEGDTREED